MTIFEKAKIIYNTYYLYQIYILIHKYNCTWEFVDMSQYEFINTTKISHTEFNCYNKFLQDYKDEKIKLAEDLIENGMLLPLYGTKDNNQISIYLGKHRVYSLLCYLKKYGKIDKKFLFIYFPSNFRHSCKLEDIGYYFLMGHRHNGPFMRLVKPKLYKTILRGLDHVGAAISNIYHENKFEISTVLNDEKKFEKFINLSEQEAEDFCCIEKIVNLEEVNN